MGHITNDEIKKLSNCNTVADMLNFLNTNYDLNIMPGVISKTILVNGLIQAIELLKPKRRVNVVIKPNPIK
jgi:hypothetical protein